MDDVRLFGLHAYQVRIRASIFSRYQPTKGKVLTDYLNANVESLHLVIEAINELLSPQFYHMILVVFPHLNLRPYH